MNHGDSGKAHYANERICLCGGIYRTMPPGPSFRDHVAAAKGRWKFDGRRVNPNNGESYFQWSRPAGTDRYGYEKREKYVIPVAGFWPTKTPTCVGTRARRSVGTHE